MIVCKPNAAVISTMSGALLLATLIVACGGGGSTASGGAAGSALPSSSSSSASSSGGGQIPAQRAVPNLVTPTAWTLCTPEFTGSCRFEGLREIRYGAGSNWLTRRFMNSFSGDQCNAGTFGGDPAPGQTKRCEVANVQLTGTIAAPNVCHAGGMCPTIDLTAIPMGEDGVGELRVRATSEVAPASGDGVGAFRTVCGFSHMAFDDPIVFPGQPGMSHLHAFFGNTGADAYSTAASLAGSGNSTCLGGIANRSAYWVPALIDTRNGRPLVPDAPIWYYKTGYGGVAAAAVQAMPAGLRMIAGDMHATGAQDMTSWECHETGHTTRGAAIPNCPVGEHVAMTVRFPQCWDGVNLDSVDHKQHMAFPTGSGCPASHPVPIPEITLNVLYLVRSADEALHWRLSSDNTSRPPGYSAHADWFDGWNADVRDTWVANCNQGARDCHAHLLGDGRMLF